MRLRRFLFWVGWKLMGFPVGVREPNVTWTRFGPYRWGAWLANLPEKGGATTNDEGSE